MAPRELYRSKFRRRAARGHAAGLLRACARAPPPPRLFFFSFCPLPRGRRLAHVIAGSATSSKSRCSCRSSRSAGRGCATLERRGEGGEGGREVGVSVPVEWFRWARLRRASTPFAPQPPVTPAHQLGQRRGVCACLRMAVPSRGGGGGAGGGMGASSRGSGVADGKVGRAPVGGWRSTRAPRWARAGGTALAGRLIAPVQGAAERRGRLATTHLSAAPLRGCRHGVGARRREPRETPRDLAMDAPAEDGRGPNETSFCRAAAVSAVWATTARPPLRLSTWRSSAVSLRHSITWGTLHVRRVRSCNALALNKEVTLGRHENKVCMVQPFSSSLHHSRRLRNQACSHSDVVGSNKDDKKIARFACFVEHSDMMRQWKK